ncbi:Transcription factor IIS family protein [Raphanus sativus]|uniref:Uncharacterized protein LOC108808024 n=1 Tax=Raphanus sativus TaxID=3726 RepID=A0A6J0JL50_RAPSA|nr:uncharacterized protein LOC108808024 [Raphanus sativus]KAJ4888547.1 Transcription factor IIS family protein [Raphanus sativus]
MMMKDLIDAAIKSTYDTRSPGGVDRCVDLLIRLKSVSLSVKDILYFSESIFKLETLRRHRNPRIRQVSQSLFTSLLKTLYSQGTDESISLDAGRLKRKGATVGSLTKKKARTDLLVSGNKQDHKTLNACKSVTKKPPCGSLQDSHKISSVTAATALPQQLRRVINDKDGRVTTKTLIPPPRRVAACKNVPAKDSRNPNTEEMVELFEAAKKAADLANAKGILPGKADASRCVEAISLLMKMNVSPKPNEPRRMMERLQGLAKHKDHAICNAALALLQLWRQRIREQERKESFATKNTRTCGQGFRREPIKAMKLVM